MLGVKFDVKSFVQYRPFLEVSEKKIKKDETAPTRVAGATAAATKNFVNEAQLEEKELLHVGSRSCSAQILGHNRPRRMYIWKPPKPQSPSIIWGDGVTNELFAKAPVRTK